jgi:hypothetical protein
LVLCSQFQKSYREYHRSRQGIVHSPSWSFSALWFSGLYDLISWSLLWTSHQACPKLPISQVSKNLSFLLRGGILFLRIKTRGASW